jgi:hypothetical protein
MGEPSLSSIEKVRELMVFSVASPSPGLDPTFEPAMPQGAQFFTQENLEDTP